MPGELDISASVQRDSDLAGKATEVADLRDAHIVTAQAVGMVMQWRTCRDVVAAQAISEQAAAFAVSDDALGSLVVAFVTGGPLSAAETARAATAVRALRQPSGPLRPPARTRPLVPVWASRHPPAGFPLDPALRRGRANGVRELMLGGRYQPAAGRAGSGGDWFDVFVLPDGSVAIAIGDVAGHGPKPAETMSQVRTLLRALAIDRDEPPSRVLARLDRCLASLDIDVLITLLFGRIVVDTTDQLTLRWCSAGHLPPMLLLAGADAVVLPSAHDLVLGLGDVAQRTDLTSAMPTGSTLVLYTDGLVETRTAALDEGISRLAVVANALADREVGELADRVVTTMVGARASDDVTLLVARAPKAPTT